MFPRTPPFRRLGLSVLACLGAALLACAPAPSAGRGTGAGSGVSAAGGVRAAFSDDGVAWVVGGRACVARVPSFGPVCPRLAPASDVSWQRGDGQGADAWAALPGPGLVVTLDRAPRSLNVGAVTRLSSARIYREDGSALTYGGERERGSQDAQRPEYALPHRHQNWSAGMAIRTSAPVLSLVRTRLTVSMVRPR